MMADETTAYERELRELFATVPAPPPPASWRRDETAPWPVPAPRLPRRRLFAWQVAVATALAVAVTAVVVLVHRDTSLTVSALPAAAELHCRLPISALSNDRTTGFVILDHGRASFEPVRTDGMTYVPALGRWLDVGPQMVAPDGRSYVTQTFSGAKTVIHVVDARADRTLLQTNAGLNVFGFSPEGILLIDMSPPAGAPGPESTLNLKLLDPVSGELRPFPYPPPRLPTVLPGGAVAETSAGYSRESNAIWLMEYFPAADSTTVGKYDLASGVTSEWFDGRTDGHGHVNVVATDAKGLPIMQLADRDLFHTDPGARAGIGQRTLLVTEPHRATVLNQGRVGGAGVAGNLSPLSVNDGDRVWLAADDGTIWMYSPAAGFQEMAKVVSTSTKGPPGVSISGPCR
jgi:hypothetical protein